MRQGDLTDPQLKKLSELDFRDAKEKFGAEQRSLNDFYKGYQDKASLQRYWGQKSFLEAYFEKNPTKGAYPNIGQKGTKIQFQKDGPCLVTLSFKRSGCAFSYVKHGDELLRKHRNYGAKLRRLADVKGRADQARGASKYISRLVSEKGKRFVLKNEVIMGECQQHASHIYSYTGEAYSQTLAIDRDYGTELGKYSGEALNEEQSKAAFVELCLQLQKSHLCDKSAHFDIKLGNICIDPKGVCTLIDWPDNVVAIGDDGQSTLPDELTVQYLSDKAKSVRVERGAKVNAFAEDMHQLGLTLLCAANEMPDGKGESLPGGAIFTFDETTIGVLEAITSNSPEQKQTFQSIIDMLGTDPQKRLSLYLSELPSLLGRLEFHKQSKNALVRESREKKALLMTWSAALSATCSVSEPLDSTRMNQVTCAILGRHVRAFVGKTRSLISFLRQHKDTQPDKILNEFFGKDKYNHETALENFVASGADFEQLKKHAEKEIIKVGLKKIIAYLESKLSTRTDFSPEKRAKTQGKVGALNTLVRATQTKTSADLICEAREICKQNSGSSSRRTMSSALLDKWIKQTGLSAQVESTEPGRESSYGRGDRFRLFSRDLHAGSLDPSDSNKGPDPTP